jgi:two-component system chemotaxis response regulator CheY
MSQKRVLSIGQCDYDHRYIVGLISQHFEAEVVPAVTAEEAWTHLRQESFHLVMVNRIFDGSGDSGQLFIQQLKADPDLGGLPVMLVSNHDDAQQQAMAAGAVRGFGKGALADAATLELLHPYLA